MKAGRYAFAMWAALLTATGCRSEEPRYPGIGGVSSDLHTAEGTYDGYRVVHGCSVGIRPDEHAIAIVGTGSHYFEASYGHIDDERTRFARPFRERLRAEIPSWSGDGYGARCTPGDHFSVHFDINDWRELDGVIRHIGARMRSDGLGEEVVISVTSGMVERY